MESGRNTFFLPLLTNTHNAQLGARARIFLLPLLYVAQQREGWKESETQVQFLDSEGLPYPMPFRATDGQIQVVVQRKGL